MSLTSKFKGAESSNSLELQDIANLERLKKVIAGFELGVHCEIEHRPLLSITPSKLKSYTDYAGLGKISAQVPTSPTMHTALCFKKTIAMTTGVLWNCLYGGLYGLQENR